MADLLYQRHSHKKKLRMTKDEVKDERKQAEGDAGVVPLDPRWHQPLLRFLGQGGRTDSQHRSADSPFENRIQLLGQQRLVDARDR